MDTYDSPPSDEIYLQIRRQIGARIEERRKAFGITQETLGKRLGVSRAQVSLYEQGKNSIPSERMHVICDVLHIDSGYVYSQLPQSKVATEYRALHGTWIGIFSTYFALPWRYKNIVDNLIRCLSRDRVPLKALEIEELEIAMREISAR